MVELFYGRLEDYGAELEASFVVHSMLWEDGSAGSGVVSFWVLEELLQAVMLFFLSTIIVSMSWGYEISISFLISSR